MEVYLDNNSTTKIDPKVEETYIKHIKTFGNVNVIYNKGIQTRAMLNEAYDKLYDGLGARDEDDIVITSSTTEGNNAVIKTFLHRFLNGDKKNHIITTVAEHSSIKAPLKYCKDMGMEVTYIGTDENGLVKPNEIEAAITDKTALISVLMASNETGAIQDIKAISQIAKKHNIYLHSDGAQAIGKIKVDVQDMGVDYFTFSSHKFHGPKGVGGLFVKNNAPYQNLIHGGNQMGSKRGGSLYLNGAFAMAYAMKEANENLEYMNTTIKKLRDKLANAILEIPDTKIYIDEKYRLPNTITASFRGIEGESMLWDLNNLGIYAATGSSCSSERLEGSEVLEALGEDPEIAHTAIIFSLSRFTTENEIDYVIQHLPNIVKRLRNISMTYATIKPQ